MPTHLSSHKETGFVLPTSLIILALLTMLALTVYFGSLSSQKMSAAAQKTTQGYYYAETAANYMQWVLNADAEMDSYANYPGGTSGNYLRNGAGVAPFTEPPNRGGVISTVRGDFGELMANLANPGPVRIGDTDTVLADTFGETTGAVMYFDNTPLAARAISWPDAQTTLPSFENISVKLPRYIKIDIDAYGNIAPTIPKLPHANPPVMGDDIPENGAIAWLTAGVADAYGERDIQLIPLDPYIYDPYNLALTPTPIPAAAPYPAGAATAYPNGSNVAAYPSTSPNCALAAPLSAAAMMAVACDSYTALPADGGWIGPTRYRIVIYALGYVNGKPVRLVRKTW
jgi:hypothetical protein